MARVLKSFNTEQEYEEWANGPDMRTPYTCLVKENGNVHYFDGDDNDFSITLVARKTGWCKLFIPSMSMENTDVRVFLNGEEIFNDDERLTIHGHYYSEKIIEKTHVEDYEYFSTVLYNHKERGLKHMGVSSHGKDIVGPERHYLGRYKCRKEKRFIFLNKDDIVKLVYSQPYQYSFDADGWGVNFISNYILSKNCFVLSKTITWAWAKEIIIGDGFRDISGFKNFKIKKLFLGKNVNPDTVDSTQIRLKDEVRRPSRIYCRKKTFGNYNKLDGLIKI